MLGETAATIKMADLHRMYEQIRDAPYPAPCGSEANPHIFHPNAFKVDGLYFCHCTMPALRRGGETQVGSQDAWDAALGKLRG